MLNLIVQKLAENPNVFKKSEDTQTDWANLVNKGDLIFLSQFNEVFPRFISKIKEACNSFNAMDIRFCVLLRMGLSTKEIARLTNSSVRAVQSRKYRIRKKLHIPNEEDLNIFMVTLS
ncbi:hypothetical protein GCM10007049_39200 [Echinicola pacifica]|uniref:RNA polymerase sigma factor 70 region 4 type 2 domain-containing protein n=1 Tax=Echinicola pacifica TaxID=346377 RepID=A0A918QFW2_9BACT|nr:sigma-70 region 4 domain-containing protein [Echinicola pacifica]GGZ42150.1 hypothetical protein GCM10007049_39200 [Echinicola pacifica]